jgi:hypothetical protein
MHQPDAVPLAFGFGREAYAVVADGQGRHAEQVDIKVRDKEGSERTLQVKPLTNEEIPKEWYV